MATTAHGMHISPERGRPVGGRKYVWQIPVRVTHWVNALSIFVLFGTGLFIATPVLMPTGAAYQSFLMGRMRELHFVFGMALSISLLVRIYWFWGGNNYARSGVPMFWKASWYKAVFGQAQAYLKLDRGQIHMGHNALAGFSYLGFLLMCVFEGVTGFALYGESNPRGFWDHVCGWTLPLMGGSFRVHMWHHMFAWLMIVFVLFHVYIVLYDVFLYRDGLIDSIIAGPKWYEEGDHDADTWIS